MTGLALKLLPLAGKLLGEAFLAWLMATLRLEQAKEEARREAMAETERIITEIRRDVEAKRRLSRGTGHDVAVRLRRLAELARARAERERGADT